MDIFSVRIISKTADELRALDRFNLDLKHRAARQVDANQFEIPGVVTSEQMHQVKAAGYQVAIISNLSQIATDRVREVSGVNRFADVRDVSAFEDRAVQGYMTAEEVESSLMNLHTLHPDLITLIELPHHTWEGRVSRAIRLRAGGAQNRAGVLFTGSMHAREWGGSDICLTFVVNLINAYRNNNSFSYGGKTFTAPQVRTILENTDIFLFPDVNPDGKVYSQTQDLWWRKNRNPNTPADPAHPGVDVNRNFDFLWNSGIGTSTTPSSETYRGSGPFSEPETRNVRYLLDAYPNIRYYVDIHSYSQLILYSWGDDDDQNTDPSQNFRNSAYDGKRGVPGDTVYREFIPTLNQNTAVNLATRMNRALEAVHGRHYTVQQAVGLYPTSATSDDYATSRSIVDSHRGQVYGFTIEFGEEFIPPFSEMRNIINDVCSAMTELCWAVNSDVYIRDNPSDAGSVPSSAPFWDSPDIWVRNAEDKQTIHQNTLRGRNNFIYVRVTNRGSAEAQDVKVCVYCANYAGTEFIYPNDWIPRNPAGGGSLTGIGTYLIGEIQIPSLAPGAAQVVGTKWIASLIPPETNWHPCLLVEISPGDGPTATGNHVWENNNLGQKNITIVDSRPGQVVEFPFRVGSPTSLLKTGQLAVIKGKAPGKFETYLDVNDRNIIESLNRYLLSGFKLVTVDDKPLLALSAAKQGKLRISLKPHETKMMALRVAIPKGAKKGDRYEFQVIQYDEHQHAVGGVVLDINIIA
jgi:carboxypeptidase T